MSFVLFISEFLIATVKLPSGNTSLIEKNDESHVHIEVLLNGEAVNPAEYFNLEK